MYEADYVQVTVFIPKRAYELGKQQFSAGAILRVPNKPSVTRGNKTKNREYPISAIGRGMITQVSHHGD